MKLPRKRIAVIVTSIYIVSAAAVLAAFLAAPPDGLANIWIAVWTLPVTILGLWLLNYPFGVEFPFVPFSGPHIGYYSSHVIYFVPTVAALALMMYHMIKGRS